MTVQRRTTIYQGLWASARELQVNHGLTDNGAAGFVIKEGDSTRGLTLSAHDVRELAFDLLVNLFDIDYGGEDGRITLIPKPVPVEVGQYYRVKSTDDMSTPFRGNPLVKVTTLHPSGGITVQTKEGFTSGWGSRDMHRLVGPLEVEEVVVETVWKVKGA